MWHLVIKVEPAEPAVGQMKRYLLAQPAFGADAVAVANDEHPDHQLGINRRPADVAIVGLELLVQVAKRRRDEHVDPAQQMVLRNAVFETELVKQTPLIRLCRPIIAPPSLADDQSATGIMVRWPSQALFRQHRSRARIAACRSRPNHASMRPDYGLGGPSKLVGSRPDGGIRLERRKPLMTTATSAMAPAIVSTSTAVIVICLSGRDTPPKY